MVKLKFSTKITIVIGIIVSFILLFITVFSYYSTSTKFKFEIESKLNILKESRIDFINNKLSNIERLVDMASENKKIIEYLEMTETMNFESEEEVEDFIFTFEDNVIDVLKTLYSHLDIYKDSMRVIITKENGLKVLDTRIKVESRRLDEDSAKEYIGKNINEYINKKENNKTCIFENRNEIIIEKNIFDDSKEIILGKYYVFFPLDIFSEEDELSKEINELSILCKDGYYLSSNIYKSGEKIKDENLIEKLKVLQKKEMFNTKGYINMIEQIENDMYIYIKINEKEVIKPVIYIRNKVILISTIGLTFIIIFLYTSIKYQLKPLLNISNVFEVIKSGNLDEKIINKNKIKRDDEIGELWEGLESMFWGLREIITNIKISSHNVKENSGKINFYSDNLITITEEISSAVNQVAIGNSKQAESLEDINNQMQDFIINIDNVEENNKIIKSSSNDMKNLSLQGKINMNQLEIRMDTIKKATNTVFDRVNKLENLSNEINKVIKVMQSISQQTNLLALNAAIEAARAGEAGKGFAVVAEEVRKLSVESSQFSEEIASIVMDIKKETEEVSKNIKNTNQYVELGEKEVNETIQSFEKIINKINESDISIIDTINMIENINKNSKEINENLQSAASITEESSASSQEVAASTVEQVTSVKDINLLVQNLEKMAIELEFFIKKFTIDYDIEED